jgi:hypothetical protein
MTYGFNPIKTNYERNYLTLIELMTKIGGLGYFFFFFLTSISKYINRYFFINESTYELIEYFDFTIKEDQLISLRKTREELEKFQNFDL